METSWESAIAQIQGEQTGTGIVIERDERLLLTCGHVVGNQKQVRVRFPACGVTFDANVVENWTPTLDAALLQIADELPEIVTAAPLGLEVVAGHHFRARGYHHAGEGSPLPIEGEIRGPEVLDSQSSIVLSSMEIAEGMSGAPLVDVESGLVVGLIRRYHKQDKWLACAVPLEAIAGCWPRLRELRRWPKPIEAYLSAVQQYVRDLPYVSLTPDTPPLLETIYVCQQAQQRAWPEGEQQSPMEQQSPQHFSLPVPMPAVEALQEHEQLVIVGLPGAGKSTLLRHLTQKLAAGDDLGLGKPYLPLLVSLPGLAAREGDLSTCLRQQVEAELGIRLATALPSDFLEEWPRQTGMRWLICLDGLDEIVDEGRRNQFGRQLHGATNPNRRIIITSRPGAAETPTLDGSHFPRFYLLPFGENERKMFAERWFSGESDHFLKEVGEALPQDVSGLPLFLTVAAIIYKKSESGLKSGIIQPLELYEKFFIILLKEDESAGRDMREQFEHLLPGGLGGRTFGMRRKILEVVALALQEGKDAEGAVVDFLESGLECPEVEAHHWAEGVLKILVSQRSGLIMRIGEVVEFIHPTFREFLAACALTARYGDDPDVLWKALLPHLLQESWVNVIPMTFARLKNRPTTDTIVERLLQANRNDFWEQRPLLLATEALVNGALVSIRTRQAVVQSLVLLARSKKNPRAGITALSRIGEDDILLALARDRSVDASCRWQVIETLGRSGKYDEVGEILRELAQDRTVALEIRQEVAARLSELGWDIEAVEAWLSVAWDETAEAKVRWQAARALWRLGRDNDAAEVLIALVETRVLDEEGSFFAAAVLGELGWSDEAAKILLALARSETMTVREMHQQPAAALKILEQSDGDESDEILLTLALDRTVETGLRLEIANRLGKLGRDDEAVETLLALTRDEAIEVWRRREAIETLRQLSRGNDLLTLAQDSTVDTWCRRQAAIALGELGRNEAAEIWLALVQDRTITAMERWEAAEVLRDLGQCSETVLVLLALAQNSTTTARVRWQAAVALGKLGQVDKATDVLLALAQDKAISVGVRQKATEALVELGREDIAAEIWLNRAWDGAVIAGRRREAAQSLSRIGRDIEAAEVLLLLAQDEAIDTWSRRTAAVTLRDLGWGDEAGEVLLTLAQDEGLPIHPVVVPRKVVVSLEELFSQYDYICGTRGTSVVTSLMGDVSLRSVQKLEQLGRSNDLLALARDRAMKARVRLQAAVALGGLDRSKEAVEILLTLARDGAMMAEVRLQVAEALRKLGQEDEAAKVLLALARDSAVGVQMDVVWALYRLDRDDDLLMLALDDAVAARVRRYAAEALGKLDRVGEAAEIMMELLRDGAESIEAVWTLSRLGRDYDRISPSYAYAGTEEEMWNRKEAAKALRRLGLRDEVGKVLLATAQDGIVSVGTRKQIAKVLRFLDWENEAAKVLLALVQDSSVDESSRRSIAVDLYELGRDDEAAEVLLALVRTGYIDACAELERIGRMDDLLALARDEAIEAIVIWRVAEFLAELSRRDEAAELLLTLMQTKTLTEARRLQVAIALGKLGRRDEATELLLALMQSETLTEEQRWQTAVALGAFGQREEAIEILLALAQDRLVSAKVRQEAAQALIKLGRVDEAAEILLALLYDESVWKSIREQAIEILIELGRGDEATEVLLALARDRTIDAAVHQEVLWMLIRSGRADDLLALARDGTVDTEVRWSAAVALKDLGLDDEAVRVWLTLAGDRTAEMEMREQAIIALKDWCGEDEYVEGLLMLALDEAVEVKTRLAIVEQLGKLGRDSDLLAMASDETIASGMRVAAVKELDAMGLPVAEFLRSHLERETGIASLEEHRHELRNRLGICTLIWLGAVVTSSVSFTPALLPAFSELYAAPASSLLWAALAAAQWSAALSVGGGLALPVLTYHALRFAWPGLSQREKQTCLSRVWIGARLLYIGAPLLVFALRRIIPWDTLDLPSSWALYILHRIALLPTILYIGFLIVKFARWQVQQLQGESTLASIVARKLTQIIKVATALTIFLLLFLPLWALSLLVLLVSLVLLTLLVLLPRFFKDKELPWRFHI